MVKEQYFLTKETNDGDDRLVTKPLVAQAQEKVFPAKRKPR